MARDVPFTIAESRKAILINRPGTANPLPGNKYQLFGCETLYNRSLAGILGYGVPFSPRDPPAHVHHLRAAIVLFSAFLRTWRAVGRGIFPLFHLTIVLASLLVHVWMAARSVTVTGTTSRPLPTSSSTCRTGGTLSRIPRAGVLYWDDIDNGTLSIEFSMLLFCPPATSRAAPEIFMCHY